MAQTAKPDLDSFSQEGNRKEWKGVKAPGNTRMGHGQPYPAGIEVESKEGKQPMFDGLTRSDSERSRYTGPAGSKR